MLADGYEGHGKVEAMGRRRTKSQTRCNAASERERRRGRRKARPMEKTRGSSERQGSGTGDQSRRVFSAAPTSPEEEHAKTNGHGPSREWAGDRSVTAYSSPGQADAKAIQVWPGRGTAGLRERKQIPKRKTFRTHREEALEEQIAEMRD